MHYYFPGMIVGIVLLQTSIIAPTLFKKLDLKEFGIVIRALWPKFFIFLSILGGLTIISLYFDGEPSIIQFSIAIATTLFALICYLIIPATNRATDEGNDKLFNILHKISVYLTVLILILNIAYLFT
tara:strand:- start:6712 stop:7092 length:381 start_codon:yes stop_codon:yes gene_type:complete